ncbi:MAG: response regulator [Pseudomonadota bacterium]
MSQPIKLAFLIEDQEVDQVFYARMIDRSGLVQQLQTFTYADEALDHLRANPDAGVDVIFLDINMPRMDGFEFLDKALQELGSRFENVVVAMLTTSINPKDQARSLAYDAVKEFISKPLNVEDVQKVARHLSDQH